MVQTASFDRGFYSAKTSSNSQLLLTILVFRRVIRSFMPNAWQQRRSSFIGLRQRHPGIESAIGALQSGNGLKRCRDHTEIGFERYLGLAILGRNIHVLGKLLIAHRNEQSAAALSKRRTA